MGERSWPYPIAKPEADWTTFDRDYIDLMRAAFAEGYEPREGPGGCVELGRYGVGRSASLVFRGSRNGWESWLCDGQRCDRLGPQYNLPLGDAACVCVRPPFRGAAHLVLEWMRGRELPNLLRDFELVGGYPRASCCDPRSCRRRWSCVPQTPNHARHLIYLQISKEILRFTGQSGRQS